MSKADVIFKEMCRDILENGTDTKDELVRPTWEDTGEKAYTIKKFGVVNKYDLREEFPALTLRRTALKSCMDEVLWIYQRKSNNIHDLKPHVWDEWADETGSIGTAYGYVVGEKFKFKGEMIDQMDYVLKQLKETPYSRRIMTNLYQFHDLATGHLDPCCYSATYNVTKDNATGKLVLNMVLNQRSQDVLAANNWNVCQYAILLMMVAQVNDMIPGELIHVIADAHIYDRHVDIIKELIQRPEHPAPKVRLNPEVKNFYDFTTDDLIVEDYIHGEQVKNIPIAV
ncbi:MAG: thymidylate synthase [Pseudobutyrivibrio sp.]|nr:thymidylate synthase [Pseudobutyrivibrio sp.]